jgi:hypothetical protein
MSEKNPDELKVRLHERRLRAISFARWRFITRMIKLLALGAGVKRGAHRRPALVSDIIVR